MTHPVVLLHLYRAFPLALYLDGVPYTKLDGVIGFWIYNLVTNVRHLLGVIRKSKICRCGCRGWCSFFPVFLFLNWSLRALASGFFPSEFMSGPFSPDDERRIGLAGLPLALWAALIIIEGDWAEYAHTMGFPTWADLSSPCFACTCTPEELYEDQDADLLSLPWPEATHTEYMDACQDCEVLCVLTCDNDVQDILKELRYDKRDNGARGRALKKSIPRFGLRLHDRLEPSLAVLDVSRFEEISTFPKTVIFWRRDNETRARHRNPLFDIGLGITISLLIIDLLHALNLGVVKDFVRNSFWELILCDSWGLRFGLTADELLEMSCMAIKGELFTWYDTRHTADPLEGLTRLQEFKSTMLGSRNARVLKTKAAETKGLLFFTVWLLTHRGGAVNRVDIWLACALALERLFILMAAFPYVLSIGQHQDIEPLNL